MPAVRSLIATMHGRHERARHSGAVAGALSTLLLSAFVGILPAAAVTPPPGLTAMLTGDSVSRDIAGTLDGTARAQLGWNVIPTAQGLCPVSGETLAWPNGEPRRSCSEVTAWQDAVIARDDPDVVIWWDRMSFMHFLTADGTFVRAGSRRFWRLRAATLEDHVTRLTAGGARIVFVATEPIGLGVFTRCPEWSSRTCRVLRFRVKRFRDITRPWNAALRDYAAAHPDTAVYIAISDTICHRLVSPCNDRLPSGRLARPDGTHYEGVGEHRAARALVRDMARALYPRG